MRPDFRVVAAIALIGAFATSGQAKTLTFCTDGIPEGFDPAPYTTAVTFDASAQTLYDRLVAFASGTTKVVPSLAESWDVSADGLEYTFHLRQGVKFQTTADFTPSRDFNADDVVFSFSRQMDDHNPYFGYAGGQWPYFDGMSMPQLIKSIDKVDDATVKFTLNLPQASFLADLAMDFGSIVSKEYADKVRAAGHPEYLDQKPVGTGPFQLVGYDQNTAIHYKANPDYWGGKPEIDDLDFLIVPDGGVRWQKLKAGQCQVMADPRPGDIAAMKADDSVNVMQQARMDVAYLAYNTTQAPFDNPDVRRALNMAIDKQAIIDAVYNGAAMVAKNPIPPTMWSYNAAVADDPYDPDTAKSMLDKAGVSKLKMKVWAMPVARSYNPDARHMAEMIKADLAKIGVDVEVVTYEWGEYLKRSSAKDRDGAVLFGWTGDNGDPDSFIAPLLGCDAVGVSNRAEWCDKAFNDLIVKASTLQNMDERGKLYEQAQVLFKQAAPWATIAHTLATVVASKTVEDYVMDPLGHHNFARVDLAEPAAAAGSGASGASDSNGGSASASTGSGSSN